MLTFEYSSLTYRVTDMSCIYNISAKLMAENVSNSSTKEIFKAKHWMMYGTFLWKQNYLQITAYFHSKETDTQPYDGE